MHCPRAGHTSLRASGARRPSAPAVFSGDADGADWTRGTTGPARVRSGTRGCASAPGPGAGPWPAEGLPNHEGRRGQTLRGVKVQGLPAAKSDWPRDCWHRRRLGWMCRKGGKRALPGQPPWDRRTGPRAAAGHAARSREAGGRHGTAGPAPETARRRQAQRPLPGAARSPTEQPLARSRPAPSLGRASRASEGTNSAYRRPGGPLLPRMPPRRFCVLPHLQRKSGGAPPASLPRHLRTRAPSAVRRRVPRAHPLASCSPPGALTPTWAQAGSLRNKDPRPLYLTGSPQNSSTRGRWDALTLHVSNWMNIVISLKPFLKKNPDSCAASSMWEPPWQLSRGGAGTRTSLPRPATLARRRARGPAQKPPRGGARPRRGGTQHAGPFQASSWQKGSGMAPQKERAVKMKLLKKWKCYLTFL